MGRLALRGHSIRGAEVISILEMYGGHNYHGAICDNPRLIYFVDDKFRIQSNITCKVNYDEFTILTVEEYNKEFPCRVGEYINIKLDDNKYCSDEIVKIIWGSKEKGPFYITRHGYSRTIEDAEYIVPYDESNCSIVDNGQEVLPVMRLYKVVIETFQLGYKYYTLFVKADSEQSMRRVVLDKIAGDKNAVIYHVEEIDLESRTCCIL